MKACNRRPSPADNRPARHLKNPGDGLAAPAEPET